MIALVDDTPLIQQNRNNNKIKYIIGGVSFFCLAMVIIVGALIITKPAQNKDQAIEISMAQEAHRFASYSVPCTYNGRGPSGCDSTRVRTVPCNKDNENNMTTIKVDEVAKCTELTRSDSYNVQFYREKGTSDCLEITIRVGECWGTNPINSGNYGCQGQCGSGCIKGCGIFSLGGAWSLNCLKHDICSWYFGASGGGSDTYCGISYNQASSDLLACDTCKLRERDNTCNF